MNTFQGLLLQLLFAGGMALLGLWLLYGYAGAIFLGCLAIMAWRLWRPGRTSLSGTGQDREGVAPLL